ncbi:MAG: choice-of-anchor B family protein, partial [Bacteroidetes bacterium]|nr:choice-of-anchor B family protein [Bacteroidota bacterium]
GFSCSNVDLISLMGRSQLTVDPVTFDPFGNPVSPSFRLNDLWGWKHAGSGRSFLVVGRTDGTAFVEVTDPFHPVFLGDLLSNFVRSDGSRNVSWRDMKVYQDHAYIVADGAPGHGIQVFDLRRLLSVGQAPVRFDADRVYDQVSSVHNIVINEASGFAYAVGSRSGGTTCAGGFHMIDLSDPGNPTFAGCYAEAGTSRNGGGYTHDAQCVIYAGPDDAHQGREICIGSNEASILIGDVTDKSQPITLSVGQYPATGYTHQGWLSEDHRYYFQGDELDELNGQVPTVRTLVWDLQDLDEPQMIAEYLAPRQVVDHNMYVRGNLLFQSQYRDGLRILDISDPASLTEVGFFDTHPVNQSVWNGSWSNYPFLDENMVAVSSSIDGLFVLQPAASLTTEVVRAETLPDQVALLSVYPNPFEDLGQLEVSLRTAGPVRIQIMDLLGRTLQTVYEGSLQSGEILRQPLSASDWAPGVYLVRIDGSGFTASRRFVKTR